MGFSRGTTIAVPLVGTQAGCASLAVTPCDKYFGRLFLGVVALSLSEVTRTMAQWRLRVFDANWRRGGAPADEPLEGRLDIQSLADLNNGFEVVRTMRVAPSVLASTCDS